MYKLSEAIDHWYGSGLEDLVANLHRAFGASNVDAPYTHWAQRSRQPLVKWEEENSGTRTELFDFSGSEV